MKKTPRTDEQINGKSCTRFEVLAGDSLRNASVPSEFTRQLELELNAANQRIKRLEEAGNELIWAFCPASVSMMTERESDALKLWNKAKEAKP